LTSRKKPAVWGSRPPIVFDRPGMALEIMTSLTMATMNLFSQVLWYAVVAVGLSLVPPQLNSKLSFRSLSDKNAGKVESNHQLLHMATYSTEQGVLSQLVEDRDACGVGFIANLNQKKEHNILKQALNALSCMEHRGATSADNISGDGAGVLTEVPWGLFDSVDPFTVTNKDGSIASAVGMLFLPEENLKEAMDTVNKAASDAGLQVKQWRDVPVDMDVLGELSREFAPTIKQVVFQAKSGYETKDEFEGILYDTRRAIQGVFHTFNSPNAYVCSMSSQTIVYKGMLRSDDVGKFYKDLTNPAYETTFAVYHRRFSTNTVPKWFLAQPMRLLAHNGEINTLLGNINWVKSRQTAGDSKIIRAPLVDTARSNIASICVATAENLW
jgi:glutamate synthase (ferredoxin)